MYSDDFLLYKEFRPFSTEMKIFVNNYYNLLQ